MKKIILLISVIFLFSACSEVQEFENGVIPQQYIDDIQPFLGDWNGSFNFHMGTLNLSLNDKNQLIASFEDENGGEDIIPGCKAQIGLLKEVEFKEKNDQVRIHRATFAFNPNRCKRSIIGRQLHFYFNKAQTSARAQVIHRQWQDYECRVIGYDPNGAPIRECQNVIRNEYLDGQFSL